MDEQELTILIKTLIEKMEVILPILISVIALAITIINSLNNVRWLKLQNTFDLLEAFYRELTAETIPKELRLVSRSWKKEEEAKAYFDTHQKEIYDVFNKFEIFSLKIKQRYIRKHIVKNFYCKLIVDYYKKVFCVYIKFMDISENSEKLPDKQEADKPPEHIITQNHFFNFSKKKYTIYQNTAHLGKKWSKYYKKQKP